MILFLGPVSGAAFNPSVTLVDYARGRRARIGVDPRMLAVLVSMFAVMAEV